MLAIFKREFTSLFQNVIGWLFLGVNLALYGLYFFVYNINYGSPNVAYPLSGTTFIFLITVPILTMRIIAEDRKNKTDQLILTSAVSVGKIVLGKFLSLAATFTLVIAVVSLSPLWLSVFGTVTFAQAYTAILGYYLYGLTCIAIGVFVSSLTESQMIAAVITFALLFLGYMMSSITGAISSSGNLLTKVLNCYDLVTPLDEFLNGNFYLNGIVYYVAVTALCLFLTVQVIQKRRWTISSKTISTSVFSTGAIAVTIAIVILANFLMTLLPTSIQSIDVTEKKLYSITDDTKDYLKTLDQDITIYVMATEDDCDSTLKKTLNLYEDSSKHITVEYIDTSENPTFASQYTDDSLSSSSMIVVCDTRTSIISSDDLYEYSVDYSTYSQSVSGYDGEGLITSALQYVTSDEMPLVYEITGHGEIALSGDFSSALSKANYDIEEVNLLSVDEISDDIAGIIINGPESDFSEDDAAKVIDYLNRGGKAFVTLNYKNISELTNFKNVLSTYGITAHSGIVAETDKSYYYNSPLYLLPNVTSTDITASLNNYVFMPYSVGLTYNEEDSDSATITEVLSSSETSVSKVINSDGKIDMNSTENGDEDGPFALGLEVATNGDTANLYVFGSYLMFDDSADTMVSGTNLTVFNQIITSFRDEEDSSATVIIPVKEVGDTTLTFTQNAVIWYGLIWGIFLPIVLIFAGIIIFIFRRKRR